MLKSYKIYTCTNGALGLHLSRAPWDPYPWVSSIQKDSTSYQAGLRIGDCLLELNGQDVLGMKISEIAALLKNHWLNESSNYVTVVIWRNKCNNSNINSEDATTDACNNNEDDDDEDEENNAHNINQQSLQKFATCLQHIAQLLECPVCLEVIKPPGWQCCNGHVLCNNCRSRSEKCPVCRVPLGPRGRCLLSDKLFTLLADSFPCDGVRSNKSSPKDRRKCSTEFHNQPKMAIVKKHHQQQQQQQERDEQQGAKKAKDFLLTSLRHRRRKISSTKMSHDNNEEGHEGEAKEEQENKHSSMQKQAMYDGATSSIKRNCNNRKSTPDYNSEAGSGNIKGGVGVTTTMTTTFCNDELLGQTSTIQQCHCITCYKPDKVAIVNNVTTAAATTASASLNKYILRIPSQGQLENMPEQQLQRQQYEEKYQNYQCPTGKLCCLTKNVMPHATCTRVTTTTDNNTPHHASMTNNNLSTTTTTATTKQTIPTVLNSGNQQQQQHQVNVYNFHKILKNEWDILAHLTQDHQLPVNQYYAEYGQRIQLQCLSQHSIICLNLKGSDENDSKVEKFFIACIPLEMTPRATVSKVAIFLYHMNSVANVATTITTITSASTSLDDEVSNFETIIENPLTGIKWFGRAHPLTTPWSHIHEKQHFFQYNVLQNHLDVVSGMGEAVVSGSDAFVIVVKRKLEITTKI
ncbi:uncharacterized protein LOC119608761 [Lucilia sericata]|uniref:uncharacterized protein LOC119608761 n=1 Tax=Lucilia sericata TaxID=13632 RepID=UPI0018A86119|nr:uncharacterized protein LOC119608761 [Lucilia sericata]XP_037819254.1 uncharacterized protein LOC119608761 [Lucilia sericata]